MQDNWAIILHISSSPPYMLKGYMMHTTCSIHHLLLQPGEDQSMGLPHLFLPYTQEEGARARKSLAPKRLMLHSTLGATVVIG